MMFERDEMEGWGEVLWVGCSDKSIPPPRLDGREVVRVRGKVNPDDVWEWEAWLRLDVGRGACLACKSNEKVFEGERHVDCEIDPQILLLIKAEEDGTLGGFWDYKRNCWGWRFVYR